MSDSSQTTGAHVYQGKVSLKGIIPPIWRKFQVAGDTTLYRLHLILQTVMGWHNQHLYRFIIDGIEYMEPPPETAWPPVQDPHRVTLSNVVHEEDSKFIYVYDFGADWQHIISIDRILPAQPEVDHPICLAGQRACPPEECGGIFNYGNLLEIIQDPNHEDYAEARDLLAESFDPEAFEVEQVNRALQKLK